MKNTPLKIKIGITLLLVVMIASGAALGTYLYVKDRKTQETRELAQETKVLAKELKVVVEEVRQFGEELRSGLIKSCERNGNPLRETVQHIIREEIRQSDPEIIQKFLSPEISFTELESLIKIQNRKRRERLREIAPINCKNLYPKPTERSQGESHRQTQRTEETP